MQALKAKCVYGHKENGWLGVQEVLIFWSVREPAGTEY